jgi:type IV pilus assembly protein PilM
MFQESKATHTLGLEFNSLSLRGAALSYHKGKPKLDTLFECAVDHEPSSQENVKQLYIREPNKQLDALLETHLVVTAVNTDEVLVRPLEIKLKKSTAIDAVLPFQAEPLLPYPLENAILDKITLAKTQDATQLTIAAIRKDHLAYHLENWHNLKIEPEVISAVPAALAVFTKHFSPSESIQFVLHLGFSKTTCILVNNGKLIAAQVIHQGTASLLNALPKSKDIETIDTPFPLEENETSPLVNVVDSLRLDIARTIYALAKHVKGKEIHEILLTGEGATIENLSTTLCRNLNKTLLLPKEDAQFPISIGELQKYALPIGSALSTLPKCHEQINFRQMEFAYPRPWKRLKQPIAIYFSLCFFVAFAFHLFGIAYLAYQEDVLKTQYLDLLQAMNRPYNEFEKEFRSKNPKEEEIWDEIPSVKTLSQDALKDRLRYLEREIQASPQTYPLLPNVPLVSDVLAWLCTHPNIVGKERVGDELPQTLQIESFGYSMIKRPEISKKQEKYQIKVELEFTSPTPKRAREFHDALIAPNELVDPKGEIKWSSNRDKYRTSFFLKDKTHYPSL